MNIVYQIIFCLLIVLVVYSAVMPQSEIILTKRKCSKKPHLDCPLMTSIGSRGNLHSTGHLQCCKVIDQYKAANKMGVMMEPGVDYNGMSITQGYQDQCKRLYDRVQALYSDGPLTDSKSEETNEKS